MERKVKRTHIDHGFGFPVKLVNVPMIKVRGEWTPAIDYNELARVVLRKLCEKNSRLSGNEIRFIRLHFELTLQEFSRRFSVTHPAVVKWEATKDEPTGMNWSTEKDIRLFVLLKLSSKSKEMVDLYTMLEKAKEAANGPKVEVDAKRLVA